MKGEKEVELWEMFNVMNGKDASREVKNEEKKEKWLPSPY